MPWERKDVQQQRVQFVIRAASGKETMTRLCGEFGISRTVGYKWLRRYRASGSLARVGEKSRRPHHSPQRTPAERERRVVELRQRYGWGAPKLAELLKREGQPLPWITVHRILKRRGLVDSAEPSRSRGQRFEREAPNQLWQMDAKGPYRVEGERCHPLSILDDHSRYAIGLYPLRGLRAEEVHSCLVETFERYGVPQAMLMDHGTPWWSTTNVRGLTWLSVALIQQGVNLVYGRVRHPQTQGKVERFHRTLKQALRHHGKPEKWAQWAPVLEHFREEYNQIRPHEALEMATPASRYRPSERAYQPQPPEWEYTAGSEVRRLTPAGCLWEGGQQWFVCEALAGQRVCLERMPAKIVVRFRHMYIREIDTLQGYTEAMMLRARSRAAHGYAE